MEIAEAIGLLAGLLSTIAVLPQVAKSFRTRSTGDLSLGYLSLLVASMMLWTAYGILLSSVPLIFWNALNMLLMLGLLALKLRHG